MKKNIFLIAAIVIFLILIFASLIILTSSKEESVVNRNQSIKQICFQENCFEVELAITTEEITKGLMFRKELPQNKGMLFIFAKEGIRSFWMKNTLIPLDIIWLNKNKEVVFIKKKCWAMQ